MSRKPEKNGVVKKLSMKALRGKITRLINELKRMKQENVDILSALASSEAQHAVAARDLFEVSDTLEEYFRAKEEYFHTNNDLRAEIAKLQQEVQRLRAGAPVFGSVDAPKEEEAVDPDADEMVVGFFR